MQYNGVVYRPPVEAGTFLVPVTEGCTHNSCTFCNMYRGVRFRMLPLADIEGYLQGVERSYGTACERIERVYLVGADPFALPAARLLERIELVRRYLPNASAFTMYARTDNVARKSDDDLAALRAAGVDDLYLGVECGLDDVLGSLNKGYSAQEERALLDALDLPECYFWAVHPLDSAKVEGVLGRGKRRMLEALDWAIDHVDEGAISRTSRVGTL